METDLTASDFYRGSSFGMATDSCLQAGRFANWANCEGTHETSIQKRPYRIWLIAPRFLIHRTRTQANRYWSKTADGNPGSMLQCMEKHPRKTKGSGQVPTGLWEMTISVIQQKGLPQNVTPVVAGEIRLHHRSGDKSLDP